MEFATKHKTTKRRIGNIEIDQGVFTKSLNFYLRPPSQTINLSEFEELAIARLKILKALETIGLRIIKGSNEYKEAVKSELKKLNKEEAHRNLRNLFKIHLDSEEDFRSDNTSHYILRLAYCKTEDLRRWFINQEVDFFRFRFLQLPSSSVEIFFIENNLQYKIISQEEKEALANQLMDATAGIITDIRTIEFYKVHFTEVLELVRGAKVYLSQGYAYVPQSEVVVIISNLFRIRLSKELTLMCRHNVIGSEEDRLDPLLSGLSQQYLGSDYSGDKTCDQHVTAAMIDGLAKTSFPLCMQNLHASLRQVHHMKHWGRRQYGLFLKGIGLNLEESLKFWGQEFTKLMDLDKFSKQYAYSIRHNYGKEGKRSDYTPYTCVRIITSNQPAANDVHGCPFRHWSIQLLIQRLKSSHITEEGANEIGDMVKQGNYQVACGRYFELMHHSNIKFHPQHPNQYFEMSQKIIHNEDIENVQPPSVEKLHVTVFPNNTTSSINTSNETTRMKTDVTADNNNLNDGVSVSVIDFDSDFENMETS